MKCAHCGSGNYVIVSVSFDPKTTEHTWSFKGAKHPNGPTGWRKDSVITEDMCYELSGKVPEKMVEVARNQGNSHIYLDVCIDCGTLIDRYGE